MINNLDLVKKLVGFEPGCKLFKWLKYYYSSSALLIELNRKWLLDIKMLTLMNCRRWEVICGMIEYRIVRPAGRTDTPFIKACSTIDVVLGYTYSWK